MERLSNFEVQKTKSLESEQLSMFRVQRTGSLESKRPNEIEKRKKFVDFLNIFGKRRLKIEEKHVKGNVEEEGFERVVQSEG